VLAGICETLVNSVFLSHFRLVITIVITQDGVKKRKPIMSYPIQDQFIPSPAPVFEGVDPFIKRAYSVLLLSVFAIIGLGYASFYLLPLSSFKPLAVADGLIWVACGWFGWRRPAFVTLGLFSVITGLFLGQLAHIYHGSAFAAASMLTTLAFIGLSAYVHVTKKDFSFLRGFLFISFFVLLGGCLIMAFFHIPRLDTAIAAFGTFVFAGWILYDTSELMRRRDTQYTAEIAAFELLLDLIGFFRWVLSLIGDRD
jgi:FtsH-binding integral membrane protein